MDIDDFLESIDITKTVKNAHIYDICESEFEIYEYLEQPLDEERLRYCYYQRWICTDTEVGIRVWYFDDVPVCVSVKKYRKSDEVYYWLSRNRFDKVYKYVLSLKSDNELEVSNFLNGGILESVLKEVKTIDKSFEKLNIK